MSENRSDSAHIQTNIVQNALKDVKPPLCCPLAEKHMPFWYMIIEARHTWTNIDLILAAHLAMSFCDLGEERALLELEGSVIMGGKNMTVKVPNPRSNRVFTLVNQVCNLAQKLQVHALATMGNARDQKKKNARKQDALEAFEEDDDLIARPN